MTEELELWPTVEPIVPLGNPVLRQKARPVKKITRKIRDLLDHLAAIMYEANGVGLAAPQVGESVRVAVVDAGDGLHELINPKIIVSEGSETAYEGCLSVPGYVGKVERSTHVQVEALDRDGRRVWVEGEGLLARALQHELDHLDGVLYVDRAERVVPLPPEQRLRVVFMGTPEFGARVLEELVESQCRVEGVVTQPDRPAGRGQKLQAPPVKQLAEEYDLEVFQPEKVGEPGFVEELEALEPDVIVTAAFGQLVPPEVLDVPSLACLNVHASLLPKYRGAAPIHRALLAGEPTTGVTIMYMDEGLDTGDMMLQAEIDVQPDETAGSLHDKLAEVGAKLTVRALRLLAEGEAPRVPQDHTKATRARRIKKQEARVDWTQSAEKIERMLRAFDPWPGAYTLLDGNRIKLFRGRVVGDDELPQKVEAQPGTIVLVGESEVVVACGEGYLAITGLQRAGGRRMETGEYLVGHELKEGQSFS